MQLALPATQLQAAPSNPALQTQVPVSQSILPFTQRGGTRQLQGGLEMMIAESRVAASLDEIDKVPLAGIVNR